MTTANQDKVTSLLFRYGGFGRGYHTLEWIDDRLIYGSSPAADEAPDIAIEPTDVQWQAFTRRLSELGVPDWQRAYDNPDVLDGTQWKLAIVWADGRQVRSSGSNLYPPTFNAFLKAVAELSGKDFQK